jgi:SAM-dependent methyltransferase
VFRKFYGLLEIPFIYRCATTLLTPGIRHLIKPIFQKAFSHPSLRALDVGCGPLLTTPEPDGLLVGVDINELYIKNYTGGFLDKDPEMIFSPPPARRRLGFLVSAAKLPFADDSFDAARSIAVFHHLANEDVTRSLQEMFRCIRPGGQIVIFDPIWPDKAWIRPLAWLTLFLDRGTHVRHQDELLKLIEKSCPGAWVWERHTYTYTGLECLILQYTKGNVVNNRH